MANLPVPNPRTAVAGEFETAAFMNMFRDAVNFLTNPPMATLVQATATASTSGIWIALGMDTTTTDTYGGHSNTTNNSRYTAQVAGWYEVSGTVAWPINSAGARGVRIQKNGATIPTGAAAFTGTTNGDVYAIATPAYQVQLNVGDYVEIWGFQSSGGALSTNVAAADVRSSMNVRWVHA